MQKFLNPRNDVAFKRIFGTEKNKDILIALVNEVLKKQFHRKIVDVTFLNTFQDPERKACKQSVVDIMCKDEDNCKYVIEMQVAEKAGFLFLIKEIELFEGSTVAIGANELTPFLGVKSNDPVLQRMALNDKITLIEKQLKKGKQSDAMLYDFSIQLRQIKQMINEMDESKKSTPKGPDKIVSFTDRLNEFSFNNL